MQKLSADDASRFEQTLPPTPYERQSRYKVMYQAIMSLEPGEGLIVPKKELSPIKNANLTGTVRAVMRKQGLLIMTRNLPDNAGYYFKMIGPLQPTEEEFED